jgi:hypothetical protein
MLVADRPPAPGAIGSEICEQAMGGILPPYTPTERMVPFS